MRKYAIDGVDGFTGPRIMTSIFCDDAFQVYSNCQQTVNMMMSPACLGSAYLVAHAYTQTGGRRFLDWDILEAYIKLELEYLDVQ